MFNAIRYTQELEKAGFSRQQAEATVDMVHQFAEQNLATKEDVIRLEHTLKEDFTKLEHNLKEDVTRLEHTMKEDVTRLEHSIVVLEHRLTIKMGTMMALAVGLIVTLQKLL